MSKRVGPTFARTPLVDAAGELLPKPRAIFEQWFHDFEVSSLASLVSVLIEIRSFRAQIIGVTRGSPRNKLNKHGLLRVYDSIIFLQKQNKTAEPSFAAGLVEQLALLRAGCRPIVETAPYLVFFALESNVVELLENAVVGNHESADLISRAQGLISAYTQRRRQLRNA